MTALSELGPKEARAERAFLGRLTESAVGAHLVNAAARGVCEVFYWRERNREVDFVVRAGRTLVAIEVKSGRAPDVMPGLAAFAAEFKPKRTLLVGGDGIPVEEFLLEPVEHWLQGMRQPWTRLRYGRGVAGTTRRARGACTNSRYHHIALWKA